MAYPYDDINLKIFVFFNFFIRSVFDFFNTSYVYIKLLTHAGCLPGFVSTNI